MPDQHFPASIATPAKTIDEVIHQLSCIIDWAKDRNSCMGYFAALYRNVTVRVKQGIHNELFDDGPRMERLDVIFANRYIQACYEYQNGQTPTQSWVHAFHATDQWRPIVLQHLLMGMNAHINLDLGIAASETVSPERLYKLKNDFDKINQVLASLVDQVQDELAEIWPILGKLNRYIGSVDNAIVNFSMEKARDAAWSSAEQLSLLTGAARKEAIEIIDRKIAEFSSIIINPGFKASFVLALIRIGERGTVEERIGILE